MDKQVTIVFNELCGLGAASPRFFVGQVVEARLVAASEKDLAYLIAIGAVAVAEKEKGGKS